MKIVIINSLYTPDTRGGAEVIAQLSAEEYARQGHAVSIITTNDGQAERDEIRRVGVYRVSQRNIFSFQRIGEQPVYKRAVWHLIDLFSASTARAVVKKIQEMQPDLIISHNVKGLGYRLPRAIKKTGIRHIHVLHDVQRIVPSGLLCTAQPRWYHEVFARVTKYIFGSPDIVIAPSEWLLGMHMKRGFFPRSKTAVIRNPLKDIPNTTDKEYHGGVFGFVGQIEEHKGIYDCVAAIAAAGQKNPEIELRVAGDGNGMDKLKFLAGDDPHIRILGRVPHAELADTIFSKIDWLIVPSRCAENAPGVIYEAFAHGVPVIAARVGGIPELVHHGENGFLFTPGSRKELEQMIVEGIRMGNGSKTMGERGRIKVQECTLENYTKQLLSL